MSEIKHSLRKHSFPTCAREALSVIEQLIATHNTGRTVISKSMDLASEIMSEFVFCDYVSDSRSGQNSHNRVKKLSCIQELQLLEVLCDYFSYPGGGAGDGTDAIRNMVFMNLFPDCHRPRSRLLVRLASVSISTKSRPVLSATGIWMQQLGCTSSYSLELAQGLVNDYFVLVPKAVDRLQDLPKLAPQFTANFLTAVAQLYCVSDDQDSLPPLPPEALLEVVTEWVSNSTTLCTAALSCQEPALPQGGIPMPPVTPFAGLFRWCILSPLLLTTPCQLYARLHLALLESLLDVKSVRENVVSAQHLSSIVEPVLKLSRNCPAARVQQALDRFGQTVQIIVESNSIYGNQQDLFKQLDMLPENRLLSLIKAKHRTL